MKAIDLKSDYVVNPAALTNRAPLFSFEIADAEESTEYKIAVSSSRALLESGVYDMWESGVLDYTESGYALYEGKSLKSDTGYYWAVLSGAGRHISDAAYFGIGLFQEDWRARWVSRNAASDVAPIFYRAFRWRKIRP